MNRLRVGILAGAGFMLFAAWASPWLAHRGFAPVALGFQSFFHAVCHQRPERSLWLYGYPCAVCGRCLGIYAGFFAGACFALSKALSHRLFLIFAGLNILDVALELFGAHGNWLPVRMVLGFGLGAAVSALLVSRAEHAHPL